MNTAAPDAMPEETPHGRIKKFLVPVLALLFVIGISVGLFCLYRQNPDLIEKLQGYGYFGAFLISLTFNASIILPIGNIVVLSVLATILPSPLLVGLAGGAGAAIGEITGYIAGYSGRGLAQKSKIYHRIEKWMKRWGGLTIFVMSIVPLVFDIVGLVAGIMRYPFWKYLLFCWAGRTIFYVAAALAVSWGWSILV